MRLFNFKGGNYISYDYILKLTHILGAMNIIPMHLMIQRQRLKLFGHIIRMKDNRQLKQYFFGEIDGVRFRGMYVWKFHTLVRYSVRYVDRRSGGMAKN